MTQSIETILQQPSGEEQRKYNLIATMSTDMNKQFDSVKNIIIGGGNKKINNKKLKNILSGAQISSYGQSWEEKLSEKR